MEPSEGLAPALARIAAILRNANHERKAKKVEKMHEAALSEDPEQREWFRSEMKNDKDLWLGMGSIADISFEDRNVHRRFIRAYYDLAVASRELGLRSIYSDRVKDIFGKWLKRDTV